MVPSVVQMNNVEGSKGQITFVTADNWGRDCSNEREEIQWIKEEETA